MKFLTDKKNITIAAGVIVVVGVAIYLFMRTPEALTTLSSSNGVVESGTPQAVTVEFVALLSRINSVSLDSSLFDHPAFVNLSSISQPIAPLPLGRPDPFAPLTPGAN